MYTKHEFKTINFCRGLDFLCVLFLLGHCIFILWSDCLPLKDVAGGQLDARLCLKNDQKEQVAVFQKAPSFSHISVLACGSDGNGP